MALSQVSNSQLLPFGGNELFRNDDGYSSFIDITTVFEDGLNFNGNTFTGLYVNTNGNITFESGLSRYTPDRIGDGSQTIIAPLWSDVDTRTAAPGAYSNVYWDFNTARDSFVVTWYNVGYYSQNVDKTNTFQLELRDKGDGNFEAIFRYADVNWTTGDASGGTGGLGGVVARGGFSSGDGLYFELPASGDQSQILSLENALGNTGVAGVWQFEFSASSDNLSGDEGDNFLFGDAGDDIMSGNGGNDQLYGGPGGDNITGGSGNDACYGGGGDDDLIAGSGAGNDHYDGGDGLDLIIYGSASQAIIVDLAAGTASGPEIDNDTIVGVEDLVAGRGNDTLFGNEGSNALSGGAGNDTIDGRSGDDLLDGGDGKDRLTGGDGGDAFRFSVNPKSGADTITDFTAGQDVFQLQKSVFKKIGSSLSKGEFHKGKAAHDGNDHIIYANNKLIYDKNGNKKGGDVVFAKVGKNLSLDHDDFVLI